VTEQPRTHQRTYQGTYKRTQGDIKNEFVRREIALTVPEPFLSLKTTTCNKSVIFLNIFERHPAYHAPK